MTDQTTPCPRPDLYDRGECCGGRCFIVDQDDELDGLSPARSAVAGSTADSAEAVQRPETSFYELHRVVIQPPRPGEFRIATAALISCSLCGVTIDGMGGPGHGPVCIRCGDALDSGKLRGMVKWREVNDEQS